MTPHAHGGLLVVLVAFVLGIACGNVVLGALRVSPRVAEACARLAPRELSRLAVFLLAVPALLGVAFTVATLLVPAAALVLPELDHCNVAQHAPHVCFVHGTWAFDSLWEALGVVVLGACLAISLAVEAVRLWRARRVAAALLDGESGRSSVLWTPDETPFAFTVGLLRPRVVVSAGLKKALSDEQLRAALAHERAHARHRHALARAAARVLASIVLPSLKRPLLALLVLGQEQEADEEAAVAVRSRALVAETLLRCFRLASDGGRGETVPGLVGPSLERRVETLCSPPRLGRSTRVVVLALSMTLMAVVAARDPLHRASEALGGVLLSAGVHSHGDTPLTD